MITRDILIEDLIEELPAAVAFLMRKHIRCIACGEPLWGTLESAAREKGYGRDEIDHLVTELRSLQAEQTTHVNPEGAVNE